MKTYGITIHLIHNDDVDLKEILAVIGDAWRQSTWKISAANCFGEFYKTLLSFSDEGKKISGIEFYNLTLKIYQTLSGEYRAFDSTNKANWLLIRSIRGDKFDVETEELELLKKFRSKFKNVEDLVY